MILRKIQNNKRIISLFIKILVFTLTLTFIYYKLIDSKETEDLIQYYRDLYSSKKSLIPVFLVVLLAIVNWGLESLKWQYLIRKIEKLDFIRAFKSTLSGVTVSIFTPNRTGEYLGRMVYIQKADRIKAAVISILGSLGQLVVTILIGVLSLALFVLGGGEILISNSEVYILLSTLLVVTILILWSYLNLQFLIGIFFNFNFTRKKIIQYLRVFGFYTPNELLLVLCISFVRYSVYAIQFFLMLRFCEVGISILEGITYIPLTYLGVTILPSIALAELGIREVISIELIGLVSSNTVGIVTASFGIWVINIAIPAIFGSIFVFQTKLFK